jgi:hypothetical protein
VKEKKLKCFEHEDKRKNSKGGDTGCWGSRKGGCGVAPAAAGVVPAMAMIMVMLVVVAL